MPATKKGGKSEGGGKGNGGNPSYRDLMKNPGYAAGTCQCHHVPGKRADARYVSGKLQGKEHTNVVYVYFSVFSRHWHVGEGSDISRPLQHRRLALDSHLLPRAVAGTAAPAGPAFRVCSSMRLFFSSFRGIYEASGGQAAAHSAQTFVLGLLAHC